MGASKRFPFSIDVALLSVVCLAWTSVAAGYHVAGIMPAGRRVWTAGAVLILGLTSLTAWLEHRQPTR